MQRKTGEVVLFFIVSLLGLFAGTALADQITLGTSGVTTASFAGQGHDSLTFSSTCNGNPDCVTGFAYDGFLGGQYDFWIFTGNSKNQNHGVPDLATPSNGIFPVVSNGATFNLEVWFGSDVMTGIVTLDNLTDGTYAPRVIGELVIQTASGQTFQGWTAGTKVPLDFVINLYGEPTVDQVWNGLSPSTYGPISSGEIINTSEPGTLILVGSGLIAIGGLLRRHVRF
jgi:hypothetical protein